MKKLVIVGSGGLAREVEWLVERINAVEPEWNFLGFIDHNTDAEHVIGDDSYVFNCSEELYVSIAIGSPEIRKRIFETYKANPNIHYANLIDPSVLLSRRVQLGEGNIICAGTVLTVDITIGSHNLINWDCTIGHDAVIGSFVTLNPSVNVSGNVRLSDGVNVGTGTQIIQGHSIGRNTVVGAGAVVNCDLPDNCTAVGTPAKVIKRRGGAENG
ncbi:MAG: acetyltransferase [Oscillospiraceae bacterium]|nr:acetyltransferase [Oscillospiraceae bacterium]